MEICLVIACHHVIHFTTDNAVGYASYFQWPTTFSISCKWWLFVVKLLCSLIFHFDGVQAKFWVFLHCHSVMSWLPCLSSVLWWPFLLHSMYKNIIQPTIQIFRVKLFCLFSFSYNILYPSYCHFSFFSFSIFFYEIGVSSAYAGQTAPFIQPQSEIVESSAVPTCIQQ